MIWRMPNSSYLVRGEASAQLMWNHRGHIRLPDGSTADSATEYLVVSRLGEIEAHYRAASTSAYEDDLYVCDIHVVIEQTFRRYTFCEGPWHEPLLDEEVLMQGLELVTPEAVQFAPAVVLRVFKARSWQR